MVVPGFIVGAAIDDTAVATSTEASERILRLNMVVSGSRGRDGELIERICVQLGVTAIGME